MSYENILVEKSGAIGIVTLNRPQQLNALSYGLVKETALALEDLDRDPEIRVIIVTGGEKVFAAGADIKEMADAGPFDERVQGRLAYRDRINKIAKPMIAAVSGYALGGGCELALSCDIIIASETARFGQPEINLGTIPGSGGTQRLTRLVGKYRAMEMVLAGDFIEADETQRLGLVNQGVPGESLMGEAEGPGAGPGREDRGEAAARRQIRERIDREGPQHYARRGVGVRAQIFLSAFLLGGSPRRHESVPREAQA